MNNHQRCVRDFHETFELTLNDVPQVPSEQDARLRSNLIKEEADEFDRAAKANDLVGVADALADLLYVVYGAANTYGIDMEPVFAEVHRSNMTKVWSTTDGVPEGCHARECKGGFVIKRTDDGKVIKPPTYSRADLVSVLEKLKNE